MKRATSSSTTASADDASVSSANKPQEAAGFAHRGVLAAPVTRLPVNVSKKSKFSQIILLLLAVAMMILVAGSAQAVTNTWTAGTAWETATWSQGHVPTASEDAVVTVTGTNLTINSSAVCASLTLGGATNSNTTLTISSGSLTIGSGTTGNLTLNPNNNASSYILAVGANTLSVAGTLSMVDKNTQQISVSTGTVTFSSAVSLTGTHQSISITSTGTVKFNGGFSDGNTTLGTVSGSTVEFGGNYTVTTTAYTWTNGSTAVFTGGATVTPTAAITFSNVQINSAVTATLAGNITVNAALTVKAGATLALSTFNLGTPTSLTMETGSPGASITGSGTLTLGGDVTVNSGSGTSGASISSPVALGATNRIFTVADDGTAATDLSVSGVVSGARTVTKAGPGLMAFSGANTYTLATTISAGTLSINTLQNVSGGASSLGAPTTVANGTIAVVATGVLQYTGTGHSSDRVVNLTASGGTIDASGSGTLTLSGGVTGNTFNLVLTGTGAGVESGVINTTTGALTKNGGGTWTLSGNNTYTGGTTISDGTLTLGASERLANGGSITLNGGSFSTGASTGFTETVGTLALANDSGIALGTGSHTLTFAASNLVSWTASKLLVVSGWTGGFDGTSGTSGKIFVGSTSSGLTSVQLSQIRFYDGSSHLFPATILSTGEVVPAASPTAVRLTGFTATQHEDGVMLEWKSGFEADNLGYRLYRYQDGQRSKVTPSLIAGSSLIRKHGRDLVSGFSYGWFDSQGTVGTQYELQAIDLNGEVQTFSPRYTAKSGPHGDSKKARATLLTEVTATGPEAAAQNGWATAATPANVSAANPSTAKSSTHSQSTNGAQATQSALAVQQSIAAQQAVKIRVNQTGWYRVTQPQLVANGFDSAADARKLQLYVDGVEVPIRLSTDKARLGASDTLEFYGVGLDALTTDTHTYYLINGTRNGLRIATNPGGAIKKNEVLAPSFAYTVERKDRFVYLPGLLNGDANNIFGDTVSTDPIDETMTLRNVDTSSTSPAQLEVVIQGFSEVAHDIQVQLNGSYVGTMNFSGSKNKSSAFPVSMALLKEGDNVVNLTAAGGDADISSVDTLRITYAHNYRADNDSLSFSVGNRSASVSGFSSASIRVIDVTNPGAVQELTPKISNSGGSYGFGIETSGTVRNLIAFVDNLARQPASMVKNEPSTWNASTNAADLVIVTHSDFRASADTLAAARRAQGLKVSVVDVEDVYDEFSYGAHGPQAVKDFFSWSNTHWTMAPRYALLFGDSSWDPRNYMGQGFSDYVPTKLVDTVEFETASDDWLADFNGDGIPEIAMGRLPARTAGDASTMVSKILNYDQERAGGAPLRGAVLVSDSGFEDQTAQVQSYLSPLTTVQTLNRSAIGNDDTMRTDIVNALDQGPTIVNYFGHGSVGVWTGAGLLNQDNGSTLTNGNRTSLFVMMTCLNGYFHDAFIDSLAETVLKDPQGGAFAVWASSGATEPVGQAQMNTQLYRSLLGNQPMTLGDAVRQAKMATSDFDVRRTWILLGDPAMRLK